MLKIVLWGPLTTEMAKTVISGSANPSTVTSLEGSEIAIIYPKDGMDEIAQKRSLESIEHKNGKDFKFG